jgi:hypothetical protein
MLRASVWMNQDACDRFDRYLPSNGRFSQVRNLFGAMNVTGIERSANDLHTDHGNKVRRDLGHNRLMLRRRFERAHPAAVGFHQDGIHVSPRVQGSYDLR